MPSSIQIRAQEKYQQDCAAKLGTQHMHERALLETNRACKILLTELIWHTA